MTAGVTRKSLDKVYDEVEFLQHQLDGIRTLARMGSFLLADEMGLGKTLMALVVAAIDFQRGWAQRVLVVCPATLKWNWQDEIEKFTKFTSLILDGSPVERKRQLGDYALLGYDILIVNYEQVTTHLNELNALGFQIIIYDEAHYVKNFKSQRTKACLKLKANRHFVLTGSPMLNQVNELWPLLHRIKPHVFPDYWRFVNRFCVYGGYQNKQIVGVKNRHELNSEIEKVMVRRLKKDVLDLPDKQHIQIYVDLLPTQRKLYDQAQQDLEIEIPGQDAMELENPLHKYVKLKQICGTAAEIPGYPDESAKLDRMVDMVAEIVHNEPDKPGEPVVVFTQFRGVLACAANRLNKIGVSSFLLHGDVPKESRIETVKIWEQFRDPHGRPGVLLCMLQVAQGFNATAANKCIFIDKLYVPKLNEQAEDRLHRIGADLTKPIQIFEIIARKTVEQRIESILKRKTKLFGTIIEESDWKRALYEALKAKDDE